MKGLIDKEFVILKHLFIIFDIYLNYIRVVKHIRITEKVTKKLLLKI